MYRDAGLYTTSRRVHLYPPAWANSHCHTTLCDWIRFENFVCVCVVAMCVHEHEKEIDQKVQRQSS